MALTVIMPCYNEASRGSGSTSFYNRLDMMYRHLTSLEYKVILVDDGSTDNSVTVFGVFVKEHGLEATWSYVQQEKNMGKGQAVLRGLMEARTEHVLVLDADMSVDPYVVTNVMQRIKDGECYIGTRYAKTSRIVNERPLIRRFVSWCCQFLVQAAFGLGVTDTQCGFKVLPLNKCFPITSYSANSWIFDVEILYNLKCAGVAIQEIPVTWKNMERETTVKAINAIVPSTQALFDLFKHKKDIQARHMEE